MRGSSPRATARWAGALNILSAVPAGFSISILRKLVVAGDPGTTAAHILGSEGLFRLAVVVDLFGVLLFIGSGVLLYRTFKPASGGVALFFLAAISMGSLIQALNALPTMAALILIKGGATMSALPSAQANALALVSLKLYSESYKLALFFDGISSLAMGCLILRSTFVPRIIGPLMWLDGLGGLTFSLAGFLSPPLATHMYPYIPFITVLIGEGALYFWLIIKSVDVEQWREQAAATDRALPA